MSADLLVQFGVALAAAAVAAATTPLVIRLARHFGFVDRPDPRRTGPLKPRLGGLAMVAGLLGGLGAGLLLIPQRTEEELMRLAGLVLAGLTIAAVGAVDDRLDLPPRVQLVGQLLAALIAVAFGVVIEAFNNPLRGLFGPAMIELPVFAAVAVTLIWLVGAMNTVNFLDGLDGLAGGVVAIAAGILFVHSFTLGQFSVATLPMALIGAVLGFLAFNVPPARITMGTTGSVFLGLMLASMAIVGGTKAATLLLVLVVPILDTAWLIIWRLAHGRAPFRGDRAHLHHRLLDLGMTPRQILGLFYALTAGFGSLALLIPSPLYKLYALSVIGALVLAGLVLLARFGNTRRDAARVDMPPSEA